MAARTASLGSAWLSIPQCHEYMKDLAAKVRSSEETINLWSLFFPVPIPAPESLSPKESQRIWSDITDLADQIRPRMSGARFVAKVAEKRLAEHPERVLRMLECEAGLASSNIAHSLVPQAPIFPTTSARKQLSVYNDSFFPRELCYTSGVRLLCFPAAALFSSLTSLTVTGQGIRLVPCLEGCYRLRYLNLSWNKLIAPPPGLGMLSSLETVDLSWNHLEEVHFEKAKSLRSLILRKNQLATFPAIADCRSLTELDLSENPIRELPPWIDRLAQLHTFRANKIALVRLPPSMGSLLNLQTLEISLNRLESLGLEVGALPSLTYLDISGNFRLSEFPSRFSSKALTLIVDEDQKKLFDEELVEISSGSVLAIQSPYQNNC